MIKNTNTDFQHTRNFKLPFRRAEFRALPERSAHSWKDPSSAGMIRALTRSFVINAHLMLIPIVPTGKDLEARLVGIPMLCDVSIHRYL